MQGAGCGDNEKDGVSRTTERNRCVVVYRGVPKEEEKKEKK